MCLRMQAMELEERAAEAGFPRAWRLRALSPREAQMEIAAYCAQRHREIELADFQAWLAGRYALYALHAPRRYPRRPDGVMHRMRRMTDAEMKGVFAAMAAEGRKNGRN